MAEKFRCERCQREFTTAKGLEIHERRKHDMHGGYGRAGKRPPARRDYKAEHARRKTRRPAGGVTAAPVAGAPRNVQYCPCCGLDLVALYQAITVVEEAARGRR